MATMYKPPIVSINLESDDHDGVTWGGRMSEKTAVSLMKACMRLYRSYPSTWGGGFEVIKIAPKDVRKAHPHVRYYEVKIILRNVASQCSDPEKIEVSFEFSPHSRTIPRTPTNYRSFIHEFVSKAREQIDRKLEETLGSRQYEFERSQAAWRKTLTPEKPKKRGPHELGPREI